MRRGLQARLQCIVARSPGIECHMMPHATRASINRPKTVAEVRVANARHFSVRVSVVTVSPESVAATAAARSSPGGGSSPSLASQGHTGSVRERVVGAVSRVGCHSAPSGSIRAQLAGAAGWCGI